MKRRDFIKVSAASSIMLFSCNNKQKADHVHYLTSEVGKNTTLEGEILHVCPIEGLKMKLRLSDGEIICVLHPDKEPFDKKQWDKKVVKITGKLEEMRLPRNIIVSNYKEKKLLCHIDHTPCIDLKWIENRHKDGSAERLLENDNEKLMTKMHQTKLGYIQVFSIIASNIVEI